MFIIFIYLAIAVWFFRYWTGRRSNSVGCLAGKTAIITGGNSGIGYATSILLASRGCRVIIADKANADKAVRNIKKLTGNQNVLSKFLDLSSLKMVREFADDIIKYEQKIDILINNAGISGTAQHFTEDRLNTVLQINYFGAFLLTHLLVGPLKQAGSARVIFMGSILAFLHNFSPANLNDFDMKYDEGYFARHYPNSKLCNIFAAQEFAKRFKKYGIVVNSADPGFIRTGIFRKNWHPQFKKWLGSFEYFFINILGRGPFIGAQTTLHLASSNEMEGKTGGHYFLCRRWFKPPVLSNSIFCKEMWDLTEQLVQLKPEEKL